MEGVKFVDVLRSFEEKTEGEEYGRPKKDYDERKIIENDVKRTRFIGVSNKRRGKVKLLRKILFESLDRIPNKYIQGMSEIGSVFVLYYFEDIADEEAGMERDGEEHQEEGSGEEPAEPSSAMLSSLEQFMIVSEKEKAWFEDFKSRHGPMLEKLVVVLTNVFRRKFEPLVADDFRLYKENIKVFTGMMKRRGVRIPELESHRFMGCIFTFFLRNVRARKDAYRVFEIVLSCPLTCPFLLLAEFHSKISKDEAIEDVGDDLFPKIIKLEEEFIETEKKINECSGFSVKNALLFGGVVSVIAAMLVYRASKKE